MGNIYKLIGQYMNKGAVVVTGGSKRIGKAISINLAKSGFSVVVHYRESKNEAQSVAEEIETYGVSSCIVHCDLSDELSTSTMINRANEKIGEIQGLINNASVFEYDDISNFEKNKWDLHMSVNGKSQLILINSLMNQLSENNEGSIVNISDQKIASPNPDYLSYTASRFAMMGMTNALALGLAPRARINSVAPGHTLASPDQTDSGLIKAQKQSPLGRGPTPDEIAESVTFLMNNKSITGQTIFVDCGERLLSIKRDIVFETEE